MNRIPLITLESSTGKAHDLLENVNRALGTVPNLAQGLANSPAGLNAWLQISGALAAGTLGGQLREKIALVVAQENGCDYCLAAHTYLGEHVSKLTESQLTEARKGNSENDKHDAALKFAKAIVNNRGRVSGQDIEAVKSAGFTDGEVVEILATVVENIFTNYFNTAFAIPVDFPTPAAV